ncbi:MAG TPA: hypothetical protein VF904_14220, partial [Anaeromyxobacteraceae bacterium]
SARAAAAAELAALAPRIEALKREAAAGRAVAPQLERLLARAQELAALLDRSGAPPTTAVAPEPEELRERADALRDRADRLAAALAEVDRRLGAAHRRAHLRERADAVGGPGDLFAETAPRRALGPPGAPGGAGTSSAPPPGPASPTSAPVGGSPGPVAAGASPSQPALVVGEPGLRAPDALAPAPRDSLAELERKRGEIEAALAALRAQVHGLEAEAKAADAAR